MKKLLIIIFFLIQNIAYATFTFSVNNSMMTSAGTSGVIDLGLIDPFAPQQFCNNFISPNSCTVLGRNDLQIGLYFTYSASVSLGNSVDVYFSSSNGNNASGAYQNVTMPLPIIGLQNTVSNNFNLGFQIPMFGVNSASHYELLINMDVVFN